MKNDLNKQLQMLIAWVAREGPIPDYTEVVFIEAQELVEAQNKVDILGGLIRRTPTIKRESLKNIENFTVRFQELLSLGFNWIHLKPVGILDKQLVISVNFPEKSVGVPSQLVAVNFSGPPRNWNLSWKISD